MPAPLHKVVAFAAAETGAGRSVCAAKIAMNLAQRSRCLIVDLDHQSRNLPSYLGVQSLRLGDSVPSKTSVANLEYMSMRDNLLHASRVLGKRIGKNHWTALRRVTE